VSYCRVDAIGQGSTTRRLCTTNADVSSYQGNPDGNGNTHTDLNTAAQPNIDPDQHTAPKCYGNLYANRNLYAATNGNTAADTTTD